MLRERFYQYILPVLGVILTLGAFGQLYFLSGQIERENLDSAREDARAFARSVTQFRNFYSAEIVPRAKAGGVSITHAYRATPDALPLPATFTLDFGEFLTSQRQDYAVQMFSALPFPWRAADRHLDDFQQAAIEALLANPEGDFSRLETINGQAILRYAVADRLKENCVACHNTYPGTPKTDWKAGDVRGVLEIRRVLSASSNRFSNGLMQAVYSSVFLILITLLLFWLALRGLRTALRRSTESNKALEETRHALEQQLFALNQHAIVSIADPAGNFLYANDKFIEISGYAREELLGANHRLVNSGLHSREFFQNLWHTITSGQVWSGEIRNRRKDGSFYWVSATIVPFLDENGKPYQYIGIRTDITERKTFEEEALLARDAAEAANRAKSDFLANMSHEIRTPMNGVIGMTELALDARTDAERREYLEIVRSSAQSLLGIINDILDFSKIEAGKLLVESIEFDLRQTISETLRTLLPRATEKGLELLCDIHDDVPNRLRGDPTRLRQILFNLVGNGIKFTDRGEVVTRFELAHDHAHASALRISVDDSGIGIPADKLASIFEAFSQADTSTTRRYGGTGLGLTITQRLIELMGGKLTVSSTPGRGSSFTLVLPMEFLDGPSARAPSSIELTDRRALIVDDNAVNREILLRQLARWGMHPTAVTSGAEAQAVLGGTYRPDIMLLDMQMPGMNGFELARWIRAHPDHADRPILVLSSGPLGEHAETSRQLGINAYLTKPVTDTDLREAMNRALGGQPGIQPDLPVPSATVQPPVTAQPLYVLLVEDNPVNQKLVVRLLAKWGHHVALAHNGKEALDRIVAGERFDLVLMDMQMPVMGGLEATQRIRLHEAESRLPRLRILAMTANAMEGDREICLEAGMDDYIAKPIVQGELAEKLLAGDAPLPAAALPPAPLPDSDFDYAAGIAEMDEEMREILSGLFLEHAPDELAALNAALARQDSAELMRRAHGLKGTLAAFGARPAEQDAAQIEQLARAGDLAGVAPLAERLARRIGRLTATLQAPPPN